MNNYAEVRREMPVVLPEETAVETPEGPAVETLKEMPAKTPEKPSAGMPVELSEVPTELSADVAEEMPPLLRYNPANSVAAAHSSSEESESTAVKAAKEEICDAAEIGEGTSINISDMVLTESQYISKPEAADEDNDSMDSDDHGLVIDCSKCTRFEISQICAIFINVFFLFRCHF